MNVVLGLAGVALACPFLSLCVSMCMIWGLFNVYSYFPPYDPRYVVYEYRESRSGR